ncbi:MAG TPA: PilZ domain-containing protein [Tepidisphaeraceae bacterium]|jgi:hypothetical protein|nr:PilZ domain-containing protein [Tepidisphaeraceae bacterium]
MKTTSTPVPSIDRTSANAPARPVTNPGAVPAAAVSDRRAEARAARRAVVVMPFGPGLYDGFEHATMTDCSLHGVGLWMDHPLAPGTHFFLKLKLATVALAVYAVKHCEPCDGGHHIGAAFSHVVGNEDRDGAADRIYEALLALPTIEALPE